MINKMLDPRRVNPGLARLIAYILVVVIAVTTVGVVVHERDNANKYKNAYKSAAAQYADALKDANIPLPQITSNPPVVIPGVPGKTGPPGHNATLAQVEQAVALLCANNACRGPRGPKGHKGSAVTPAMVATAVLLYCNSHGQCLGKTGKDGTNGAPGPPGQNATDDQVAAEVALYCANNNCKGDKGDPGPKGDQGMPGPDECVWVEDSLNPGFQKCDRPDPQP